MSYVQPKLPGAVVVARRSPLENPSGGSWSVYASTLLPRVCVAPGGSYGSAAPLALVLKPSIDTSTGVVNAGRAPFGAPAGCGV